MLVANRNSLLYVKRHFGDLNFFVSDTINFFFLSFICHLTPPPLHSPNLLNMRAKSDNLDLGEKMSNKLVRSSRGNLTLQLPARLVHLCLSAELCVTHKTL